ncbi:hypothetical protein COUCH_36120 [Couchioplanes caeruleus]|uniref:hypothetical protein n=1 Tax=Couchioplanes caeruleus TaxID=56438 RepID=UPI0020BDE06F|nr:hypothetical protein [Couchioplanes caeruleus]UQU64327.1 hypothetical protein COUCH_36120 [Couchioplanes caeruleus]
MSWRLLAVVLAVLAGLTLTVGASLSAGATAGDRQSVVAGSVTDRPGGTCVTCT